MHPAIAAIVGSGGLVHRRDRGFRLLHGRDRCLCGCVGAHDRQCGDDLDLRQQASLFIRHGWPFCRAKAGVPDGTRHVCPPAGR